MKPKKGLQKLTETEIKVQDGYSAPKYATIPTQSTPAFRSKVYHDSEGKVTTYSEAKYTTLLENQ